MCWTRSPGDYAVIARRKGNEWYLGAITSAARTITIDCDFLGAGYTAYIYKDSDDPTMMATDVQAVDSSSVLMLDLAPRALCYPFYQREFFTGAAGRCKLCLLRSGVLAKQPDRSGQRRAGWKLLWREKGGKSGRIGKQFRDV